MSRFRTLRRAWFDEIAEELAWLLEDLSPAVASAVPKDLGPRTLVSATVLARVAQADMECQEIAFVAGDLVRLAGEQGVRAPERVEEVEELWTALREPTVPLLRSWWREPLGEGFSRTGRRSGPRRWAGRASIRICGSAGCWTATASGGAV